VRWRTNKKAKGWSFAANKKMTISVMKGKIFLLLKITLGMAP
jgi:hypothetical protein